MHRIRNIARALGALLVVLGLTAGGAALSAPPQAPEEGVININQASVEQLSFLPGVGATKAQRIIEHREKTPFKRVVELARVKGIGLKTVRKLKAWLRVDGATTLAGPIRVAREAVVEPDDEQ